MLQYVAFVLLFNLIYIAWSHKRVKPKKSVWCAAAISIWTSSGDADHVWIVGSYFHYSVPGGFTEPKCKDISPKGLFGMSGDPMYVVYATKKA